MNILFLGDIVGDSGCISVKENLPNIIKDKDIDFVVVNGENAAKEGVGITENITNELLNSGVDAITTGNHVWDQKETYDFISKQNRLLRPLNLLNNSPGKGFEIYMSRKGFKVGVLNLMGNIFMKKCNDVFVEAKNFLEKNKLKHQYDFLLLALVLFFLAAFAAAAFPFLVYGYFLPPTFGMIISYIIVILNY